MIFDLIGHMQYTVRSYTNMNMHYPFSAIDNLLNQPHIRIM